MDLLIATTNTHKFREIRTLLKNLKNFDFFSFLDFPNYTPPEEKGNTFEANASLKATHAASALNLLTLADDSGLVVPSLNGAPGVYSARFAGKNATDKENRVKLLKELREKKGLERAAYFECCVALAKPRGPVKTFKGVCEGEITIQERGGNGFGYDPLFLKYDYSLTFGEIDESLKNKISHRAKAIEKLKIYLEATMVD